MRKSSSAEETSRPPNRDRTSAEVLHEEQAPAFDWRVPDDNPLIAPDISGRKCSPHAPSLARIRRSGASRVWVRRIEMARPIGVGHSRRVRLTVRQMVPAEARLIVDYFHSSTPEHLELLGVDPTRLPEPDRSLATYVEDARKPLRRTGLPPRRVGARRRPGGLLRKRTPSGSGARRACTSTSSIRTVGVRSACGACGRRGSCTSRSCSSSA
jgi:hypothetical protein